MFTEIKQAFLYALVFLTRLPVSRWLVRHDGPVAVKAVYCYPLVGLLIGLILAVASIWLTPLGPLLAGAVLLGVWVVITGALHLDGLADCMDAYYAGHKLADTRERRARILQVMHDPACGAVALVSLVVVLLVKAAAIVTLLGEPGAALALCLAPILGRTVILPFMALADDARDRAPSAALEPRAQSLWLVALVVFALVCALLGPLVGALVLAGIATLTWAWWRFWMGQIGGYTGDCLGALVELTETLALILLVALW